MKFKIRLTGADESRLKAFGKEVGRDLKAGDEVELDVRDLGGLIMPVSHNIYSINFSSNPDYEVIPMDRPRLNLSECVATLKELIG